MSIIIKNLKNWFKNFKFTFGFLVKSIFTLATIAYFVILAIGKNVFDPMNEFWRGINIFGTAGDYNLVLRITSYVFFFIGGSSIIRFIIKQLSAPMKKGKAIVDMFCSLIKYAAAIVFLFFVLKHWIDTTAILAGIGIVGLIVGLGAQPLIADIIAGLFIVFEGVFDVGDIIVVDGFRGVVKEIGIRTTQLVDTGGNVKIINNAHVQTVINMTNQLSLAICDIGIEYGESIERVESILKENFPKIKEAIPDIKEGPFYKGVSELGDSAVVLRFAANCDEGAKYQVERDMNRQFKLLFDKYNINIPFPQVVVNQPVSFEAATSYQQQAANSFVEEQKELSKGIADTDANNV